MRVQSPSVLSALSRVFNDNAAPVTVNPGATLIASVDLGLVVAGQLLFLNGVAEFTKGLVAGTTLLSIAQLSGTGDIHIRGDSGVIKFEFPLHPVSTDLELIVTAFGLITVSGTMVLQLFGQSLGSTSNVGTGEGVLTVITVLR